MSQSHVSTCHGDPCASQAPLCLNSSLTLDESTQTSAPTLRVEPRLHQRGLPSFKTRGETDTLNTSAASYGSITGSRSGYFAAANIDVSLFAVDNLLLRKLQEMTVLAGSENKPLIGFSCVPFCSLTSELNPLISPCFNVQECSVISVFKDAPCQSDPQSVVAAARLCRSRDRSCRWIQALRVLKDVPTGP